MARSRTSPGWAFFKPVRKVFYNITITSLSVVVALVIGPISLIGVLSEKFTLDDGAIGFIAGLDLQYVGYVIVALPVQRGPRQAVTSRTPALSARPSSSRRARGCHSRGCRLVLWDAGHPRSQGVDDESACGRSDGSDWKAAGAASGCRGS